MKKLFVLSGLLMLGATVAWIQSGCTPTGTLYNPVFSTPQPTPTVCSCLLMYSNGTFAPLGTSCAGGGICSFSGAGDSAPTLANNDTTAGSSCCGNTKSFQAIYSTLVSGGYTGLSAIPPTSPTNMSAYTTCTFYARANETATVGFNAAEPSGDTANVAESLTTSWAKYTINIADGARSDSFANSSPPGTSISQTVNYFVEVIVTTPSTPVTVNFDQVQFQ